MMALVLLVAVSTATFAILISAMRTISENGDRVQAASIARSELDRLRGLGAASIPIGLTVPTNYTDTGFTVKTTANWVGINQDTNPCQSAVGGSPGRSYMSVHIEVSGDRLSGPQVIDAIVPPTDDVPADASGSVTVWVRDQASTPQPVSGVLVHATSTATGAVNQSATTGYDGCVFFTGLVPGSWTISIDVNPPYMVKPSTSSASLVSNLAVGQNSPVSFYYATGSTVHFSAGAGGFTILNGLPFTASFGSWAGTVPTAFPQAGLTVPSGAQPLLWPDPTGYSARLGCVDATTQQIVVQPGVTTELQLSSTAIEVIAPANKAVTVTHATGAAPCAGGLSIAAGTTVVPTDPERPNAVPGPLGRTRFSVPFGTWTVQVAGEADKTLTLSNTTTSPCSVTWPAPSSTPSPTATPTPTATSTAAPQEFLPAISSSYPPCSP